MNQNGVGGETKFDDQTIVFVLGGPGSGKGTLCTRLKEEHDFAHLSVGELQREEAKKETERGLFLRGSLAKGQLTPDAMTIDILLGAMKERSNCPGFLIDGFPRTREQGNLFAELSRPADLVIYLEAPDEVMEQRILDRAEDLKKRGLGHQVRSDDTKEAIRTRLAIHHKVCVAVLQDFDREVLHEVKTDRTVEEVFREVDALVVNTLERRKITPLQTHPVFSNLTGGNIHMSYDLEVFVDAMQRRAEFAVNRSYIQLLNEPIPTDTDGDVACNLPKSIDDELDRSCAPVVSEPKPLDLEEDVVAERVKKFEEEVDRLCIPTAKETRNTHLEEEEDVVGEILKKFDEEIDRLGISSVCEARPGDLESKRSKPLHQESQGADEDAALLKEAVGYKEEFVRGHTLQNTEECDSPRKQSAGAANNEGQDADKAESALHANIDKLKLQEKMVNEKVSCVSPRVEEARRIARSPREKQSLDDGDV